MREPPSRAEPRFTRDASKSPAPRVERNEPVEVSTTLLSSYHHSQQARTVGEAHLLAVHVRPEPGVQRGSLAASSGAQRPATRIRVVAPPVE